MNLNLDKRISDASEKASEILKSQYDAIDSIVEFNQRKVLSAFIDNNISESHFNETTGYGYGDRGREGLDSVFAQALGAEAALVRHNFTCGTHTLAVALFGILRPHDTMLCVTGLPYDTIHPVIGLNSSGMGSLKDYLINYKQVDLDENDKPDLEAIKNALTDDVKMVYIQRSRGYTMRPSLSVQEIGEIAKVVKTNSNAVIMVDNCYGEFVQTAEPLEFGADIIAGSLIKNPGGGIAKNGGYIAGRKDLIELCAYRLTTPGLGTEVGASLGHTREMMLGFFNAPHVVGEAMKSAVFTAALFQELGYEVTPTPIENRFDIIQSVKLCSPEALIAFCQGMQKGAPVDSFVEPQPWDMPGYESQVIMSAGAFTMGSSIELSADAPLREPYTVWMQGGLNFHSAKVGILLAAQEISSRGLLL